MEQENDSRWVRPLLRPAENVLWYGKPSKLELFTRQDLSAIPIGLLFCAMLGYAAYKSLHSGESLPSKFLSILFIGVGLYAILGRYVVRLFQLKNAKYALTSQRLLQQCGKQLKSVELNQLPMMHLELNDDGSGTIYFGSRGTVQQYGMNRRYEMQRPVFEMVHIENANRVGTLIQTAREQLLSGSRE